MRKIALRKYSKFDANSDPNILQSFPFITNAAWYQDYWYEREPGRIHKLVALLLRLRPGRNKPSRKAVEVLDSQSRLHASGASTALHGSIATRKQRAI